MLSESYGCSYDMRRPAGCCTDHQTSRSRSVNFSDCVAVTRAHAKRALIGRECKLARSMRRPGMRHAGLLQHRAAAASAIMGFVGAPHSMHTSLLSNAFDMNSDLGEVGGGRARLGGHRRRRRVLRSLFVRVSCVYAHEAVLLRMASEKTIEDHVGAGVGV